MTFTLLKIRFIQLWRALKEGGSGSVLLPLLLTGLSFATFKAYQNLIYGSLIAGFLFLSCLSFHLRRKDKFFAQLHIPNWRIQFYAEYVTATIPFSFTALFSKHYYLFPLLLLALLIVPFIQYSPVQKTKLKNISKIFTPSDSIEWISGIRRNFPVMVPIYVLAIVTCRMRFLPLLLLWFITTTILNFYNEYESLNILKSNHHQASHFLNHKIKKHCLYVGYFYCPILVFNAIFNSDFIDINILFLLVQFALLTFAITNKYTNYIPAQINIASNSAVAIISIGSIIPYLLPLPLMFSVVYYKRAIQNLKNYFHD